MGRTRPSLGSGDPAVTEPNQAVKTALEATFEPITYLDGHVTVDQQSDELLAILDRAGLTLALNPTHPRES